jgi:hypothetical protein
MIETFKEKMPEALKGNSTGQPKKRNAMSVAKEIRKEGESFTEAKKRASKKIADDKESAKQTIKSELDKLNTFIKSRKKLANIKGTDLLIDSKRKALPKGKRISKNTGKVYYEYRDSKTDRLSPNYPKNAPYLAGGGSVSTSELNDLLNRINQERLDNIYFNGLCYGERDAYKNLLSTNQLFIFKNKSSPSDYLDKSNYFNEISKYKFGLSLNGAAKICYRDLEYFGLGILCLREPLHIKTNDPLIDGVHYITLLDDDIRSRLYYESEHKYIMEKITDKINLINSNDDYIEIIKNARQWFEDNCLPTSQIKKLELFLNDCGII